MVVLGDGEHHNDNASNAIGDFLGDRGCIHSLRLHPHAQTNEEASKGKVAASSAGRASAWLFRSRRRLIGRASGEPCRPLRKLDQVCDPRGTEFGISGERSSLALRLASVLQEAAPRLSFARTQRLARCKRGIKSVQSALLSRRSVRTRYFGSLLSN